MRSNLRSRSSKIPRRRVTVCRRVCRWGFLCDMIHRQHGYRRDNHKGPCLAGIRYGCSGEPQETDPVQHATVVVGEELQNPCQRRQHSRHHREARKDVSFPQRQSRHAYRSKLHQVLSSSGALVTCGAENPSIPLGEVVHDVNGSGRNTQNDCVPIHAHHDRALLHASKSK